jgi:hypothetical protein
MGTAAALLFVVHVHSAGGRGGPLYLANLEGRVVMVRATPQCEVESVGSLDEPIFATPAISGDRIYIRTPSAWYCLARK